MIIEIRGTKTENKGAELMLRAIVAEIGDEVDLAVEPRIGTYKERAMMGLLQKLPTRNAKLQPRIERLVPGKIRKTLRKKLGITFETDVDAVLDAWGFAYSDQFDAERCEQSADRAARLKQQSTKWIIMPQAFGPFTKERVRDAYKRLLENTALVFAREQASYDHVMATDGKTSHVKLAPDFTCLLHPPAPANFVAPDNLALVVPSEKLLTSTSAETKAAYLPFLKRNVEMLRQRGLDVRLLVHERNDAKVVDQLNSMLDTPAPVIGLTDALSLKGIIGTAQIVVSSRFHALVSALTQGVPALAVGWSHKYEMLLSDYGCHELVVDPSLSDDALDKYMSQMLEGEQRAHLISQLEAALATQQQRTREMWSQVRSELGLPQPT